jgi:hypothetical protein
VRMVTAAVASSCVMVSRERDLMSWSVQMMDANQMASVVIPL